MKKISITLFFFFCFLSYMSAQAVHESVYVDKNGRMRWESNQKEAYFWGVNYTAPFAHAYRQILRNGVDPKKAIETDAYHLSRIGVNAYRIHVWDCEISDEKGNLINNQHLDLLDYLIWQFQQRGIYILLTPIAYWGNGYPEPNEDDLPGFSGKYNKGNVYTDAEAIAAQERYLKQFLNHANPYSGVRYKDDPMIVAFEICNEPGHSLEKAKETTAFVRKMREAVRSTGCKKPVLYNVTQSIGLLKAFIDGGTNGVTFQWYPSGLVAGFERQGNFLPHVDSYDMPFRHEPYFARQARIVYEFDAADIGRSYMYPPMALSFKEAGMQWVTQFAYDPMSIAAANTEYQTHFLNLAYAPQKAIGFKIAGELFRDSSYQRARDKETSAFSLPDVTVSYEDDLSELSNDRVFYYTNHTGTKPKNETTLESIAGYGASPVVAYNGRGAYFLDKISSGMWRLEVMPDAVWVRDPFSRATPRIENVVIAYEDYPMAVRLPDLGDAFFITGINEGNRYQTTASGGQFQITPGAYILSKQPFTGDSKQFKAGQVRADEYYAPKATNEKRYFLHSPPSFAMEEQPVILEAEFVTPTSVKQLTLQVSGNMRGWRPPVQIPMEKIDTYLFRVQMPDSLVKTGTLNYVIRAGMLSGEEWVYPGGIEGPTFAWDYYNPESYTINILPRKSAISLINAEQTDRFITYSARFGFSLLPVFSSIPGETFLKTFLRTFPGVPLRGSDPSTPVFVLENFIGQQITGIAGCTSDYSELVIHAKAEQEPVEMEIALISKDGSAYTAKAILTNTEASQTLPLDAFKAGKMALLPRPFPGFLPFWYAHPKPEKFDLRNIERIQLIIPRTEQSESPSFELKSILLK
ncbi:MAG: cellulase family glycosylhydrolase [Tannerellaceae bacterium]|jgi:hypothetical protein|nr:cellulase family glycosylhydrolase [Tannerellaceae bacterium]